MERGEDLLALALLMPTLRDWLAICQRRVPVVFGILVVFWHRERFGSGIIIRTCRPGVSMPAVTTRLEITKQDMRKGKKTGSPVSV